MASPSTDIKDLASEHTFRIVIWFGLGICIITFALRLAIRIICFQRLFAEDYLMLLALSMITSITAVLHTYLSDIYLMSLPAAAIDLAPKDYSNRLSVVWRVDGVAIILSAVGTWIIKMNFMLFFYRLGHQIRAYATFWWISAVIIVACGAIILGMLPYDCMFENSDWVNTHCSTASKMEYIYSFYKANVALDVLSDFIIIVFPIFIMWNTKISLHQKLILSGIFSLVMFTIAVTIVRGSIFFGVYKSGEDASRKGLDPSWMVFWFFIELIVSFIVACLVSFRSLWTNKKQDNKKNRLRLERQQAMMFAQQRRSLTAITSSSTMRNRWDNLLDTLANLEGTVLERNVPENFLLTIPSERWTVDFSQVGIVERAASAAKTSHSSHGSHNSSDNENARLVSLEYATEPQALAGEYSFLQQAEPRRSYHRPGRAV